MSARNWLKSLFRADDEHRDEQVEVGSQLRRWIDCKPGMEITDQEIVLRLPLPQQTTDVVHVSPGIHSVGISVLRNGKAVDSKDTLDFFRCALPLVHEVGVVLETVVQADLLTIHLGRKNAKGKQTPEASTGTPASAPVSDRSDPDSFEGLPDWLSRQSQSHLTRTAMALRDPWAREAIVHDE